MTINYTSYRVSAASSFCTLPPQFSKVIQESTIRLMDFSLVLVFAAKAKIRKM